MELITLDDNSNMLVLPASAKILSYTPQLFTYDEFGRKAKDRLMPFGSSVLIKTKTSHYMATATHCVKNNQERVKFYILNKANESIPIQDPTAYIKEDKGDQFDMALIKLSPSSVEHLSTRYQFLNYSDLWKATMWPDGSEFIVVGFPTQYTKFTYIGERLQREPLVYKTYSVTNKEYEQLGYTKDKHTLLGYDKRRSTILGTGEMSMGPDPTGISGCGFWRIKDYLVQDINKVEVALVGIMYSKYPKRRVIVGGNIEMIGNLLEQSIKRFGE
jgi:hypothetical protein